MKEIGCLTLVLLVIVGIITLIVIQFSPIAIGHYSDGSRTGLINKISKKGLFCKTWEGYMLVGNGQNIQPETFFFTIKDEETLKKIQDKVGQIATLEYDEKIFTTSCWGDSSYEITSVKE